MNDVFPKGWIGIDLDKILVYGKGKKPKTLSHTKDDDLVPYINIKAFEQGIIDEYADTKSSKLISKTDILVVWDGARFGLTGMGMEGAAGSTLMVLTPILIHPEFLYNFINRHYSYINSKPKGTGTPHVNPDIFWQLQFPIAPLNEQKRIIAKLDQIMPLMAKVKQRLDKIPAIIKRFRQSVLTAAVTGKLTEKWRDKHPEVNNAMELISRKNFSINKEFKELYDIPDNWIWCALGNYADLSRGRFSIRPRNDPRYYNGKYPFIQIGNLPKQGGFITEHNQTLNELGLRVSKQFKENTIAIAIVGATIGNTGLLAYEMCFPDSLIGIITPTKFSSLYVDYYLRTEKENIRNISYSSGGQPNIKLPTLTEYPFPLPPLPEQEEIVRQVDKLFALSDKLGSHYQKAKARVDKLSQSILAKAFRGELVITEAELAEKEGRDFESAEKLLERILDEKAKLIGIRKSRGNRKRTKQENKSKKK